MLSLALCPDSHTTECEPKGPSLSPPWHSMAGRSRSRGAAVQTDRAEQREALAVRQGHFALDSVSVEVSENGKMKGRWGLSLPVALAQHNPQAFFAFLAFLPSLPNLKTVLESLACLLLLLLLALALCMTNNLWKQITILSLFVLQGCGLWHSFVLG
uniref:Uncharacterized protein n=1 Tax=Physcomitrium patens TaxID=3218 RepID=A0A2K1JY33_PHYPA|nr:hypothetical protein PHYPA_013554 [Physcomitrium patens]